MAPHGALRTDSFDPGAIFDRTENVLVPGPTWPTNPRDVQLKQISYCDPEAVRAVVQALKDLQAATTLSPSKTDDDLNYQVVVYRDVGGNDTIFATNPDDPTNPTAITLDAAATALTEWYQDGELVATRSKVNVISDMTVTDDAVNEWVELTGDGNDGGGGGGASLAFKTFAVATQSDVVADLADDTMTFEAGDNVTITTNASTDTITWSVTLDGVGYDTVEDEGAPLTKRSTINFVGAGVSAADSGGETVVTIPSISGSVPIVVSSFTASLNQGGGVETRSDDNLYSTGDLYRVTSTISARTGTGPWTLGDGTAVLLQETGSTGVFEETATSHTIYNSTESTIATDRIIQIYWLRGLRMAVVDDC